MARTCWAYGFSYSHVLQPYKANQRTDENKSRRHLTQINPTLGGGGGAGRGPPAASPAYIFLYTCIYIYILFFVHTLVLVVLIHPTPPPSHQHSAPLALAPSPLSLAPPGSPRLPSLPPPLSLAPFPVISFALPLPAPFPHGPFFSEQRFVQAFSADGRMIQNGGLPVEFWPFKVRSRCRHESLRCAQVTRCFVNG